MFRQRRNKLRIGKMITGILILMLIVLGIFAFFSLLKPNFINPLSKEMVFGTSDITSLLTSSHISFASVSQTKDLSFDIVLPGGAQIIVTPKKDLNYQVSSLQEIIKQLTIDGKELKKIDFRFDKPVIVFK